MPVVLELFCGTKSIGKAFREIGWEVFSLDLDPKCNADLCKDIMDVTPDDLPPKVDFLWASPPCTEYSIARTNAKKSRDLEGSDVVVQRALTFARFFGCPFALESSDGAPANERCSSWDPLRCGGLLQIRLSVSQENGLLEQHRVDAKPTFVQTRLPGQRRQAAPGACPAGSRPQNDGPAPNPTLVVLRDRQARR